MSAPDHRPTARRDARRPWLAGGLVLLLVLAVTAGALALRPRQATAAAGLTVTPRTESAAAAAVLLADRYAALASAPDTVREAAESDPALSDVPLADLSDGLAVERVGDAATITVRSTLPDRADAVRAADAVVDVLVAEGAAEELVDVARVSRAAPERSGGTTGTARWLLVGLLTGLALALATVALTAGRRGPAAAATAPDGAGPAGTTPSPVPPDGVVDDLPGFLERPPGSTAPPSTPRSGSSAATAVAAPAGPPARPGSGGVRTGTVGAVVLLLGAAVLAGTGRTDAGSPATAARSVPLAFPEAVPAEPDAGPTTDTGAAAGSLAFDSVLPGGDGLIARAAFTGLLLEERAVGLTVTTPTLSVSTDGDHALAHVRLPVWNCLTAAPPAEPAAAGCARGRTEYADLADPGLQVRRDGGRIELTGLFPTYTRPNGGPPSYTGRAYRLTATLAADGAVRDGRAPAGGTLQLGLDSAPASTAPGVTVLEFPG
ncbi:hypothetical protein [Modestobacter sp. SYSU DS0290]